MTAVVFLLFIYFLTAMVNCAEIDVKKFIPQGFKLKEVIDFDSDKDGNKEKVVHCENNAEALFFVLKKHNLTWKKYNLASFPKECADYFLIKDLYNNPLGTPGDGLPSDTTVLIMGMRKPSTSVYSIPFKWTGKEYQQCR